MLRLLVSPTHLEVYSATGLLVGRYHYRDAFKPYWSPLRSPRGHNIALAMPHDHRHHKGLMYALRAADCNFWEETGADTGRIVHMDFDELVASGEEVYFTETLSWIRVHDDALFFDETRTIRMGPCPDTGGYRWTWETQLVAQRDMTLVQSEWSFEGAGGLKTNYHGLGLRLPREFGGPQGGQMLEVDGKRYERFEDAMGSKAIAATYVGPIDGTLPVARVGVRYAQPETQQEALFVMREGFGFLALGPSNAAARRVEDGEDINGHYTVSVFDAA